MKGNIKKIVFFTVFIFLLLFLIVLCHITYTSFFNKLFFENYIDNISKNNISDVFSIDRVVLFSSCYSDSTINANNTTTISNLMQYTDIAIFINNANEEFSMENTLKSVSIKNISFNAVPSVGLPNLYYKSLTDFATHNVYEDNILDSELDFNVSSEDEIDYTKPILFNNCANPITLCYVNSNIVQDYTVPTDDGIISYDGSLLKRCNVLLNTISCNLSFVIYVENNLGEKFKCPIYIDIPLQGASSSIYDGSFTFSYNPDSYFLKYE